MKKIFYSTILCAAAFSTNAQQINLSWENITYSGTEFSFDIVMSPGTGYSSIATPMDAANLRFYISNGATESEVSTVTVSGVPAGYLGGGTDAGAPATMPDGVDYFEVTVLRGPGTADLLTAGSNVTIASVTVMLDGDVEDAATLALLPPLPDGETSGPYSFWSYGESLAGEFNGEYEVPLPVEFISFTAKKANAQSLLNWATAKELNNIGFDVERSADGKQFSKIGYVATKTTDGYSSAKLEYSFTDAKPLNGVNYYRLKQQDIDGKFAYSTIASVTFGTEQAINMYPNPTENHLTVAGINAGNVLRVIDVNGKIVSELTARSAIETFNLSNLASGIYSMQVLSDGAVIKTTQISKK